ncbi:hypothetical protein AK812_SmicGene38630 [Symbiodinium microadriaticum]|uniref:Uncharacterized protein n=1 Tax=Symbiodinium microadriaticum TaxID=2951 RepID=A0A1Q9CD92_SYMMI|nr:hypothetical protein AK812_SmicGene38630 [Symbiodinium microadriaticum]
MWTAVPVVRAPAFSDMFDALNPAVGTYKVLAGGRFLQDVMGVLETLKASPPCCLLALLLLGARVKTARSIHAPPARDQLVASVRPSVRPSAKSNSYTWTCPGSVALRCNVAGGGFPWPREETRRLAARPLQGEPLVRHSVAADWSSALRMLSSMMCLISQAASAESVATLDAPTRVWGDWNNEEAEEHGDDSHAILDECGDEAHHSGGWGDADGNAESWVEDAAPQDESWVEAKDSDARNPWPADQDWDDTGVEASKDSDARNPCTADQGWDDTRAEASKDSDATKPWPADQGWDDTYDPSADADRWWLEESAVPWPATGEGQGSHCMWRRFLGISQKPEARLQRTQLCVDKSPGVMRMDFPDPTDDDIFNGFIETMGIDMDEEAPVQPDYHDDDLANHDMEEAKEETFEWEAREREREKRLVLASKQPVEYQSPAKPKPKGAMEPSTEIEADAGEEGEEELQEEPEEENDHEDDADEEEDHDHEEWDEADAEQQEANDGEDDDAQDDDDDDDYDDEEGIPTSGYPDDPAMDESAGAPPAPAPIMKSILRAPSSISVQSETSSMSPMGLRDPGGKVRVLDEATRNKIQAMTHPNEMEAGERRRQRETMRRFEFLKAFILDPNMSNMHIEAHYTEWYAEKRSEGANVSKVGTKIKARKQVGKADAATRKKLGEVMTSQAADFVKGTEEKKKPPTKEPKVLSEEEVKKKDFDKTMAQINDIVFAGYDDEHIYWKVDEKRAEIEAATKAVLAAEDIVTGHYRLASEKKKAEKAASKEGATTDAENATDSPWDTEWEAWESAAPAKRAALPQAFQLDVPMALRSYWEQELAATNTFLRHLMAVATAFRDMEMLMINNGPESAQVREADGNASNVIDETQCA